MTILSEKIVLVTGSTRGIGRATAERFLAEGARVIVTGSRAENVRRTCRELDLDPEIHGFTADLADEGRITALFEHVERRFGGLDILVNNAGMSVSGPFGSHSWEELKRLLDVNIRAPHLCCRHAFQLMKKRRAGRMITVSSSVAGSPMPLLAAYSASKAAVSALTLALRMEAADYGIKMFLLEPGAVDTDMGQNLSPEFKARFNQAVTRLSPKAVAEAILELCRLSDKANPRSLILDH